MLVFLHKLSKNFRKIRYWTLMWKQPLPAEIIYLDHIDGRQTGFLEVFSQQSFRERLNIFRQRRRIRRLLRFGFLTREQRGKREYFAVTAVGRKLLSENRALLYLEELHLAKSPSDVDMLHRKYPKEDEYQVTERMLAERLSKFQKASDWPRYRDALVMRSSNFMQAGLYDKMLCPLIQVCWLDYHGAKIPGYLGSCRYGRMVPGILGELEYALCKIVCPKAKAEEVCCDSVPQLPKRVQRYGCSGELFWPVLCETLEQNIEWDEGN